MTAAKNPEEKRATKATPNSLLLSSVTDELARFDCFRAGGE